MSARSDPAILSPSPADAGGWEEPRLPLELPASEVHVFRALRAADERSLSRLESLLAPRERERAARFRFRRDRMTYVAVRGALRQILGGYLGREPSSLVFREGIRGKPLLEEEARGDGVRFNISHSGELALLAFARGREVGVDVERVQPSVAREGLERRYFSAGEARSIEARPEDERALAFFRCWTAKEALLKATGEGLSGGLDAFSVSSGPEEEVPVSGSLPGDGRWRVVRLRPGEGYTGAVAAEGSAWRLRLWRHGS